MHPLPPPCISAVSPQDTFGGSLSIIDFRSSFNLLPCISVSQLWGRGLGLGTVRHLHCFTCTHVLIIKCPFRANEDDCIELMLKAFSSDEIPRSLLQGKLECMNNYCK